MSLYKSVVLTKTASDVLTASIHVNEVIMALSATSVASIFALSGSSGPTAGQLEFRIAAMKGLLNC
jgi:hypothetical protein